MTLKHARTLLVAAAVATGAVSYAAAQSAPSPANQSGGGISATTPSPTDPGTAGETGSTKGTPAASTKRMHRTRATSGSGMKSPSAHDSKMQSMEKNKSPSSQSPANGIKNQQ